MMCVTISTIWEVHLTPAFVGVQPDTWCVVVIRGPNTGHLLWYTLPNHFSVYSKQVLFWCYSCARVVLFCRDDIPYILLICLMIPLAWRYWCVVLVVRSVCVFNHASAEVVKEIRGVIGGAIWGDIPRWHVGHLLNRCWNRCCYCTILGHVLCCAAEMVYHISSLYAL